MATFAPPARFGDFIYSSVLYADPGNGNHHGRASVAELAALLRPEAPNLYSKGRKPEVATPAKDQVWHFYSAQLIHYGLPVTKDKNAAKVRLLNAMNQFKLEVPAWVLKVESELKAEWEAENRKLKKNGGAVSKQAPKSRATSKLGLGSSHGVNGGVNVTVNLALGGASLSQYMDAQQASNNIPRKPAPAKRKRAGSTVSSPVATPQKVARVKKEPAPKKAPIKKEPTARRSVPNIKKESRVSAAPSTPSRSRIKQEQYQPSPDRMYPSPHIKTDPYPNYYQPSPPLLLSGTYSISCATASSIFNDYNFDLTLARDPSRGIWWATFRWGAWDGIIQMNPGPGDSDSLGQPCSLGWRLRDLETGQLTFGRKCTGYMTFSGDGSMEGCLYEVPGVGSLEFEGMRVSGGSLEDDLKGEWDGFVVEAYRR
ncbi:hypothetical protein J4E90_002864 [Alternaria incomplexa]|uniref:uncharacterized protein n=1 Tax=Alternaria incomplexa TaxID=1187928 RepID=UPI00221F4C9F|nr:uncharacterized protein J4E90_002864 [Alternaria incomplexa]KAI4918480.1 hypothetical protein J4E90_002864 [Alternaria incomplexa]